MFIVAEQKEAFKPVSGRKSKIYFENLDAIRFIAALMVYLQHGLSKSYEFLPIKGTYFERFLYLISSGGTGVSIFFVLSGFLITFLLISEHQSKSRIDIKKFYLRRVYRIWPLYLVVVLFSFVLYPGLKAMTGVNDNPLGSNLWYHVTFLSNFDVININENCAGSDAMSQNITWSVSVEEQFYLFWPLIFAFTPIGFWLSGILVVIVGSIGFRLLHYDNNNVLYFHTFSVLIDLGTGGLFALLIKQSERLKSFFEKTSTLAHLLFLFFAFCLLFWKEEIFDFEIGNAVSRIATAFAFALIISAQAITKSKSPFNLKSLSFASKWGKYTYGMYMLHPIAITLLDIIVRLSQIPKENFFVVFAIGIAGFILTLVLSRLSYDYFESRFLKIKEKYAVITTHN